MVLKSAWKYFLSLVAASLRSNCNHKFGSWTALSLGKAYIHMEVRVSEHQGVSPRTGEPVKGNLSRHR